MGLEVFGLNGKVATKIEELAKEESGLGSRSSSQKRWNIHHSCCPMNFHCYLFWPYFRWRISKHGRYNAVFESLDIDLEQLGRLCGVGALPQFIVWKKLSCYLTTIADDTSRLLGNAIGIKTNFVRRRFSSGFIVF